MRQIGLVMYLTRVARSAAFDDWDGPRAVIGVHLMLDSL